jgi:uncharacterized lipoprotein YbaY
VSTTNSVKCRPTALISAMFTLAVAGCSANSAAPPPSIVATTTTVTSPTTIAATTTSTTSTTTLDPKTSAAAAARTSWETFRANIKVCLRAYPNCDVDTLLVPSLTNPYKDLFVSSYAKLQADAKVSGAIWVDIDLNSDLFENIEFTNGDLTEAILTACASYQAREIIPATLTTPEIIIDDEPTVRRYRTTMALERDGIWRVKDTPSPPIEFEGVEKCPQEN